VFKKVNLNVWQTCPDLFYCKYQVLLYGSEAITYYKAILLAVTEPALRDIRVPPPPLQAAPPSV
jgi:hypothetical protein